MRNCQQAVQAGQHGERTHGKELQAGMLVVVRVADGGRQAEPFLAGTHSQQDGHGEGSHRTLYEFEMRRKWMTERSCGESTTYTMPEEKYQSAWTAAMAWEM